MSNKKNIVWSTVGIACNVFISLFFLIIAANINTVRDVGIFSFAFSLANTMYVLGSFGGRTYQVTDSKEEFSDDDYVGFRILSSISMIIITILFVLANGYDVYKSSIIILLVIFKFIESISDVYYGVMQKDDNLYSVGISMTCKAIIGILFFFIVDYFTKNLVLAILALVVVNLILFILYDLKVVKNIKKISPSFNKSNMKRMLKTCVYFFAFTFLSSIVINFPRYGIDVYSTEETQAIFGIIIMPATSIALFGQFILQPILLKLSNLYNMNKFKEFSETIKKAVLLLLGFTILCEIGAFFLGIPVLNLVYNMELQEYKFALLIVIFGALFSTIASVLSVALTTMRVTREQLILYIINTLVAAVLSMILVKELQLKGGVYAYLFIMLFQFISYMVLYLKNIKKKVG